MKIDGPATFEPILGSQGIQILPLELWTHVFRHVPWHSRHPITLVCQTFRWLAQPLLFENVEIKIIQDTQDTLADRLGFISSPHIAPAVLVCRMYTPTMAFTVPAKFREMGLDALARFSNLISLRLDGFTITNSLLKAFTKFRRLSELELVQSTHEIDETVPLKRPIPLRYLKSGGMPVKNDTHGVTSATLVHPTHTHTLVLGPRSHRFLRKLLNTSSTYALRSLTIRPGVAASPEFTSILDACPVLEELRFPVERSTLANSYLSQEHYDFNEPSATALSRLQVFQGPWYMVEAFTKDRPVAHLVIWGYDERESGSLQMVDTLGARCPIESLEFYLMDITSAVVNTLRKMRTIRALSLVIDAPQPWEDVHSKIKSVDFPSTLEYFACYTSSPPTSGTRPLKPLFPKEQFPRLRYLSDNETKSYDPATGDVVEDDFIENWQRRTLRLYRPLMDFFW